MSPSGLQVVMGLHDKDTKRQGQPDTYYIRRLIGHPGFGRGGRAMPNDIALIQLSEPVDLSNPFVSTIQMADHMENFEGNKQCFITGWGTLVGGGRTPNVLQEAGIDVWDLPSCNRAHGITGISSQQVCVGKKGKSGGCHGDSGGPLVCKVGATWKLASTCGTWRRVTAPTASPASPASRCVSARRARAAAATETPVALWCARLEPHGSWLERPPGASRHAVPTTPPSTPQSLTSDPGSTSTPAFNSFFFKIKHEV